MTPNKMIPQFQAVALIEAILNQNHPLREQALALYADMAEEVRLERVKLAQEDMHRQREHISEEEWSRIVD